MPKIFCCPELCTGRQPKCSARQELGQGRLILGLNEVMAEIEQFAPDRALKIKTKLAAINRPQTKEDREFGSVNILFGKGATPEELIRAAPVFSPDIGRNRQRTEFGSRRELL